MKRQPAPLYEGPTVSGIDVSHWQGSIDWARVAASGQKYAIVRTGDGKDTDRKAVRNLQGAHDAGLPCAVYHYMRARHGAGVNLGVLMDVLAHARGVPLGFVAIDVEGAPGKGSREASGAWMGDVSTEDVLRCVDSMGRLLEGAGHRVVIYTGVAWHWHVAQQGLGQFAERWASWQPYYTHRDRPSVVSYPDGSPVWEWQIWQHAGSKSIPGSVPGIDGNVDLNRFRGDELALRAWWSPGHRSTPPAPRPAFARSEIEHLAERAKGAGDVRAANALLGALDLLDKP